ncbi:42770_t:CDS:2, partial [Gigaspora margarita]
AKLQREDTAAIETPTSPLEFSPGNSYINRDKSKEPVNKLSSTNMNISNDYEPVDTDMKTQNSKKVLSIEMFNKPEPTTTHTILEEPPFTNIPHGKIKIKDMNRYEELVKKYLQVGQPCKIHRNTLHNGCILTVNTEIKQQPFQITNIYAPPKQEDKVHFFEKWTPTTMKEKKFVSLLETLMKTWPS